MKKQRPETSGRSRTASSSSARSHQDGFTLVETLIAIVILAVGLVAVVNLLVVSARSNFLGNATTAAAAQAAETLERLKAIPFNNLKAGGSLTADAGTVPGCDDQTQVGGCVVPGNFNSLRAIPGPGPIRTRWVITTVDVETLYIRVLSASTTPFVGSQARAEFTTFRSCTAASQGCP